MNALQLADTLCQGYTGPAAEAATVLRQQAAEIQRLEQINARLLLATGHLDDLLQVALGTVRELAA